MKLAYFPCCFFWVQEGLKMCKKWMREYTFTRACEILVIKRHKLFLITFCIFWTPCVFIHWRFLQGVSCSLAVNSKAYAGVVPPYMNINPHREAPSVTASRHAEKFCTNIEPVRHFKSFHVNKYTQISYLVYYKLYNLHHLKQWTTKILWTSYLILLFKVFILDSILLLLTNDFLDLNFMWKRRFFCTLRLWKLCSCTVCSQNRKELTRRDLQFSFPSQKFWRHFDAISPHKPLVLCCNKKASVFSMWMIMSSPFLIFNMAIPFILCAQFFRWGWERFWDFLMFCPAFWF